MLTFRNCAILAVVLIALTVLSSIRNVAAISCYICNSRTDGGCALADRISNDYRECNSLQDRCLKVVGPGDLVVRSCAGSKAPGDAGCIINGDIKTCVCYDNYCNTADTVRSSVTLFSIVITVCLCYLI